MSFLPLFYSPFPLSLSSFIPHIPLSCHSFCHFFPPSLLPSLPPSVFLLPSILLEPGSQYVAQLHGTVPATICEHSTAHKSRRAARIDPSSKPTACCGVADAARPCMYVCPLISATSHIGITKERIQQIHRNIRIVLKFADFSKDASFKSYGIICLPQAVPAS